MKKTNRLQAWIYFALALILVVGIIYLSSAGSIGEEVDFYGLNTDKMTVQSLIGDGTTESEIRYIAITDNGMGYILKKDSKYSEKDITKFADYHFVLFGSDIEKLNEMIENYNTQATEHADWVKISTSRRIVGSPWFEKLLPYLSVIVIVVLGLFLIRSILGANNKSFSFGKTNAQVVRGVKVKFSDVAGIDEEKEELQEVVQFLEDPQKFTRLGAKTPKGILLVGLPGTGKTLLAKAIAGEGGVPFFSISGSNFVEMFVGVGASRVRDLFEQAKKEAPCIVFIDEIDAVGRQRGAGLGGGNDEREQTLNQLLVQMDGFDENSGIIVIAATNRADVLDPALLRPGRFDRQIYINPPDVKGREMILAIHAKNKPLDKNVDLKVIARMTSGFTGADLENLLNESAIKCAKENRNRITMLDIQESINKVIMGPQKKSRVVTDSDKRITAFHESGHAIIGKVLPHCDVVQEVSIISRGMAAGYTLSRPDKDEMHMSYNKLMDNITMFLGGRVAEEMFIKDISTGASSDIEKATSLARKMVTEWGMSRDLGPVNFGSDSEVFLGRDYQRQVSYSDNTASKIDEEVQKILNDCYSKAKEIISSKTQEINTMVTVLLEKETIYYSEVEMIMQGKTSEEILEEMAGREKRDRARVEIERAEAELERVKKEQAVRIKTALALKNGGVLSPEEIEKVKEDSERVIKNAEDKVTEVRQKYSKENLEESETGDKNESVDSTSEAKSPDVAPKKEKKTTTKTRKTQSKDSKSNKEVHEDKQND